MPSYFFHVFDDTVTMDEYGQEAADIAAAEKIALNSARDLVCDQIRRGYLNLDNYIVVADGAGRELSRTIFRNAFVVQRRGPTNDNAESGEKLPD